MRQGQTLLTAQCLHDLQIGLIRSPRRQSVVGLRDRVALGQGEDVIDDRGRIFAKC